MHLCEADALSLLQHAGRVFVPPSVEEELGGLLRGLHIGRLSWIEVKDVGASSKEAANRWEQSGLLHAGEAEAIALARELPADWFLTDDLAARLFAQALGMEAHGSLGVVLWSAAMGHLDRMEAQATLERLGNTTLWISQRVLRKAQAALGQLLFLH